MSGVVAVVLWVAFSVWVILGVTRDVLRNRRMLRHRSPHAARNGIQTVTRDRRLR